MSTHPIPKHVPIQPHRLEARHFHLAAIAGASISQLDKTIHKGRQAFTPVAYRYARTLERMHSESSIRKLTDLAFFG